MLTKLGCGYFATSRSMIRNKNKSSKLPFKYMHRWSTMLVRVYNHNRCQKRGKIHEIVPGCIALGWAFILLFFRLILHHRCDLETFVMMMLCPGRLFTVKSWKKVELSHMLHQAAFAKRTAKGSPLRQRNGCIQPDILKKLNRPKAIHNKA